jgi:hypothetical protein
MFAFSLLCLKLISDTVVYTAKEMYQSYTNYNKVVIESAYSFHEEGEQRLHKEDITKEVIEHFQGECQMMVPEDVSILEVRYRLNGKKYRIIDRVRIRLPYTMQLPTISVKATDVNTGHDYSERFAKYAGPWGDFHGVVQVSLEDFFPSWSWDEIPKEIRVEVTKSIPGVSESSVTLCQNVTHDAPYNTCMEFS